MPSFSAIPPEGLRFLDGSYVLWPFEGKMIYLAKWLELTFSQLLSAQPLRLVERIKAGVASQTPTPFLVRHGSCPQPHGRSQLHHA